MFRNAVVPRGRAWAYAGAVLGAAVSIAANVAHSYVPPPDLSGDQIDVWRPRTGAVLLSVFWPVALVIVAEILARVAWPSGRRWVLFRCVGLLPVAVVAAVVSYRHLSGLLAFYGEDSLTVHIGPLAVDGLMTMASAALLVTARPTAARSVEMPSAASSETTTPTVASSRLRLPTAMQEAIAVKARQAAEQGRALTAADVRDAVRVPEDMAARIAADSRTYNGHHA